MGETATTISTRFLGLLVQAASVPEVAVRAVEGGWTVHVRVGTQASWRVLVLDRSSDPRVFASLDTVGGFLLRSGVQRFSVEQATQREAVAD